MSHRNAMSWSDLQHAAYSGNYDVLMQELEKPGANPDEIDGLGRTLLIHAAAQGHTQIVRALLLYGADVNFAPSSGDRRTALHWAALNQHMKCCELLQAAGADGAAEDIDFVTPQDLSVMSGGSFIIIPNSNPIPLSELESARLRVDPDSFPILLAGDSKSKERSAVDLTKSSGSSLSQSASASKITAKPAPTTDNSSPLKAAVKPSGSGGSSPLAKTGSSVNLKGNSSPLKAAAGNASPLKAAVKSGNSSPLKAAAGNASPLKAAVKSGNSSPLAKTGSSVNLKGNSSPARGGGASPLKAASRAPK